MKKSKKTIAFFNGFYIPHLGGVERYTSKVVEILKKDYNIIIVTTNDNNYPNKEELDGIKVYRLPVYSLCKNRYPFLHKNKEYKSLLEDIRKEKIDYVICNTRYYQTSILGAVISKEKKCPLYIIDHSSNHISIGNKVLDYFGSLYEHYLTKKIKKYNPKFYGVSKRCNKWLKHFDIKASGVFYNAIDDKVYDEFYKKVDNGDTIIISYIGRIIKEKGILNLLDAFVDLRKKYSNIELYVAGDGPLLDGLKNKYTDSSIHFLGKLNYEEVMNLCVKTDMFVHPSMYPEGLPTSILEAGVMKCAVIATDRGGTKEVINNNNVGLIVEENVDDLIKKMNYLLENKDKMNELKENIHRRIIQKFTWKQTAKSIEKELENER